MTAEHTTIILSVISLLGGLALFLYGMDLMGDGLKNTSAATLKRALEKVTYNTFVSFLLGVVITAIIQSSTATIVLVAGLIAAGALNLKQSIGIVLGANVGTTITAQIIRLLDVDSVATGAMQFLKPETLAPLAAVIGIIFIMFIKRKNARNIGMIVMGFGILFFGLLDMTQSMNPLSSSPAFSNVIEKVSGNPGLGFLVGVVVTFIVQSSSASVGILQTISQTGKISFTCAYTYVIGAAIGTCIVTALICSIGTKEDAKRISVIHVLFNVVGAVAFMLLLALAQAFNWFPALRSETYTITSGGIADFQTIYKLINAVLMIPFAGFFEKISRFFVKDRPRSVVDSEIEENIRALDEHLFVSPAVALEQTKHVVGHMGDVALQNFEAVTGQITQYSAEASAQIEEREAFLDIIADSANEYLLALSPKIELESDNATHTYLLQTIGEFERIGDLAVNLSENADEMAKNGTKFSENAQKELIIISSAVKEIIGLAKQSFCENSSEIAKQIEPLEEVIDDLVSILKERHVERLKSGACTISTGLAFLDNLINLERISDQCSNVALYVIGRNDSAIKGNEHNYIQNLHSGNDREFTDMYNENRKRFVDPLLKIGITA